MGTPINFEDIQPGDKIRIVDISELEVTSVGTRHLTALGHGSRASSLPPDSNWNRSFELIERPLPPLPTEPGSVIVVAGLRWFLRELSAGGMWVPSHPDYMGGSPFMRPGELANHAKQHGGFEVLL